MENLESRMYLVRMTLENAINQANERITEIENKIKEESDFIIREMKRQDYYYWLGLKVASENALNTMGNEGKRD